MYIKAYLKEKRELIDSYLKSYFEVPSSPLILHEAIKYSLFAGGKRIRPILAIASYEACGGDSKEILPQASALELIHTYSLIHDDLPAMDNDDLRRGKPTNHKVFGEAMAILAGDALLTEAFFMMTNTVFNGKKLKLSPVLRVIRETSLAVGACGMVGGQAQDILSENLEPDIDTLEFIHLHKTAALITVSVRMGSILALAPKEKLQALTRYGENIGLTFQIIDDILDIEGNTKKLGKTTGSDNRKKKMTYPSLFGIEKSRKRAQNLISDAMDALRIFSREADPLREIASYLIKRRA
ncbi:MAG: polyprenyl synthetase family protein [Nitrospirota bacterium]